MFAFFQQRFKEKKKKKSCLVVAIPHYVKGQGLPRDYLGAFSGGDKPPNFCSLFASFYFRSGHCIVF